MPPTATTTTTATAKTGDEQPPPARHRCRDRRPPHPAAYPAHPAQGGDPAEHAAFLTAKADLLTRIADEDADDQRPCQHGVHTRHVAAHARAAAAQARTLADTARTNPKDTK